MKKIIGILCLFAAAWVFGYALRHSEAEERDLRRYVRQAAEARDRELEISNLRNKLAMDALTVGDDAVKHIDSSATEAEMAKERARLAELEKAEKVLGTASMNEDAVVASEEHRWLIFAEYAGSMMVALLGIGLLLAK